MRGYVTPMMPCERASAAVRSEVEQQRTLSPWATFFASSSTKISAVDPLPSPSWQPSWMCISASTAAMRFISAELRGLSGMGSILMQHPQLVSGGNFAYIDERPTASQQKTQFPHFAIR